MGIQIYMAHGEGVIEYEGAVAEATILTEIADFLKGTGDFYISSDEKLMFARASFDALQVSG